MNFSVELQIDKKELGLWKRRTFRCVFEFASPYKHPIRVSNTLNGVLVSTYLLTYQIPAIIKGRTLQSTVELGEYVGTGVGRNS